MKNRFFNSNEENKTKLIRETLTKISFQYKVILQKEKDFDFFCVRKI